MKPIPFPIDFAAEERQRMLNDSQPLNGWGVFFSLVATITFWAVVVGLALSVWSRHAR